MSGHSKWSTIKRKKERTDNQRAKIYNSNEKKFIDAKCSNVFSSELNMTEK